MSVCRREIEKAMRPLLKYAYVLSRDPDLACDLVQDCVVKALSARNQPERGDSYRPWLFSILRNAFFDHLRRNKRLVEYQQDLAETGDPAVPVRAMEDSLINCITVRSGMEKLTAPHREILTLIDVAGFSYVEAAQLLGVPQGTVMSRLSRARQNLLEELSTENIHAIEPRRLATGLKAGK